MANEATKADLAALEKRTNAKIQAVVDSTNRDLEALGKYVHAEVAEVYKRMDSQETETRSWATGEFNKLIAAVNELKKK